MVVFPFPGMSFF